MSNEDENQLTYDELLLRYKNRLRDASDQLWGLKKTAILNLAEKLKKSEILAEKISAKLAQDLKDCDITDRYIRKVLGEEFTQDSKRRQKKEITITNDGSVAHDSEPNHAQEPSQNLVTNSNSNYEIEKRLTYETNHNGSSVYYSDADAKRESRIEELQLENGRLREQLKEQKEQVQELIKSVNNAANIRKDKSPAEGKREDSTEISSLKAQLFEITRERDELKQLETIRMRENPGQTFQTASNVNVNARPDLFTVEMATTDSSKFFKTLKDSMKVMYITIQNNKVVGFESDAKRQSQQQQGDQIKAAA